MKTLTIQEVKDAILFDLINIWNPNTKERISLHRIIELGDDTRLAYSISYYSPDEYLEKFDCYEVKAAYEGLDFYDPIIQVELVDLIPMINEILNTPVKTIAKGYFNRIEHKNFAFNFWNN
jgi:hypothetical protein